MKKFEKNNEAIAINVLFVGKGKLYTAYFSKYNPHREKTTIILRILNGEKWQSLAVKKLSPLFRGIASKNNGTFYCLNSLHKRACENKSFCRIIMPFKDAKVLEFDQ